MRRGGENPIKYVALGILFLVLAVVIGKTFMGGGDAAPPPSDSQAAAGSSASAAPAPAGQPAAAQSGTAVASAADAADAPVPVFPLPPQQLRNPFRGPASLYARPAPSQPRAVVPTPQPAKPAVLLRGPALPALPIGQLAPRPNPQPAAPPEPHFTRDQMFRMALIGFRSRVALGGVLQGPNPSAFITLDGRELVAHPNDRFIVPGEMPPAAVSASTPPVLPSPGGASLRIAVRPERFHILAITDDGLAGVLETEFGSAEVYIHA